MTHFDSDFLQFFRELAANNHKDWFDDNRKRYENSVKKPFENFIGAVIERVKPYDDTLHLNPKDAIFRINRDIRFSKDKTPYKLNRTAIISPYGRKDKSTPGFYMYIGPDKVMLGGGAYEIPTAELQNLRTTLTQHYDTFNRLVTDPEFKKRFGEIQGQENKRLPKELGIEADSGKPLLYKKQLYFMKDMSAESAEKPNFLDIIEEHFKVSLPINQFLREAM